MSDTRRGAVILLRRGDPEIAEAIASGMQAARCGQLTREQIETVEAEIDRQRILPDLVRVAVGNSNTPDDYALMITKIRGDCQRYTRPARPLRRFGQRLLGLYGLLCYIVVSAYRAQDRVLVSRGRQAERARAGR